MKIKAKGEVKEIRLSHKGYNMQMANIMPAVYEEVPDIEQTSTACFEFKDLLEVDMMISMLQRFKEECVYAAGRWTREK